MSIPYFLPGAPAQATTGHRQLRVQNVLTPSGVTATVQSSGSVGSNLVASGVYGYTLTATAPDGTETNAGSLVTATEGTTPTPISVTSSAYPIAGAVTYTIYRTANGGTTANFLATTPTLPWLDTGALAPDTTRVPPVANVTGALVTPGGATLSTLDGDVTWVAQAQAAAPANAFWVAAPDGTAAWTWSNAGTLLRANQIPVVGQGVPLVVASAHVVVTATTTQTVLNFTTGPTAALYGLVASAFVNNGTSGNAITFGLSAPYTVDFTGSAGSANIVFSGANTIGNGSYAFPLLVFPTAVNTTYTVSYTDPTNTPSDSLFVALVQFV